MSKRYALVHNETGKVVNCMIWDGVTQWSPPAGHSAVRHDLCNIGDFWDHEKKELHQVCRLGACEDPTHETERSHTYQIYPEHKE